MKFSLTSPSKLNLRLKVVGRRAADGYHLLKMLNVECGLSDSIEMEISVGKPEESEISVALDERGGAISGSWCFDVSKNLAGQAAVLYFTEFRLGYRATISIKKNIPIGAGLGGGSSNGASVLKELHRVFGKEAMMVSGKSFEEYISSVKNIALRLGADVPYFLTGGACLVEGIGELVTPLALPYLQDVPVHLLIPSAGINTEALYAKFRRDMPELSTLEGQDLESITNLAALKGIIENDLELAVVSFAPVVGEILGVLRKEGETISVTGSGSACFVLAPKLTEKETSKMLFPHGVRVIPSMIKSLHNPLIQLN